MRIFETNTTRAADKKRRIGAASADSVNFSEILDAASATQTQDVAAAAPPATPVAVLSVQEYTPERASPARAVAHGQRMLSSLDRLQHALLEGTLNPQSLGEIRHQVEEEKLQTNDPVLQEILDEIELRAAVELAKMEMTIARQSTLPELDEPNFSS